MTGYHSRKNRLVFFALTTLLVLLAMMLFISTAFAEQGGDSTTACEVPEAVVLSIRAKNNDVILNWTSSDSDYYEIHSVDYDFYFEADNFSRFWDTEFNSFTFLEDLGDPAYNFSYGIVATMDCGEFSELSNRVGSFNFALTPGSS